MSFYNIIKYNSVLYIQNHTVLTPYVASWEPVICRVLSILRSTTRSATLQTGMSSWGTTAIFEAGEPPAGQDAGAGEAQRGNSCWSLPSTSRIWNEENYFYLFWFCFDASNPQHSYCCCISIFLIPILYLNQLVLIKENGYFWKKLAQPTALWSRTACLYIISRQNRNCNKKLNYESHIQPHIIL